MLKAREERIKVLTRARMRCGTVWSDVCIVNLSSRGVGLQCAKPPERGEYVELRRGSNVVVVGCVVWSNGHRFGLRTQNVLWIDGILNDQGDTAPALPEWRERRAMPRVQQPERWSYLRGRAMQFGFVATGAVCFAIVSGGMVQSAFARPMAVVSAAMGER